MRPLTPPAQPTCTDGAVRLVAIGEHATQLRATLTVQRPPQEQQRFAAPEVESLPLRDADPRRLSVAILVREQPVGMFALDRSGYLREFDDDPRPTSPACAAVSEDEVNRSERGDDQSTEAHRRAPAGFPTWDEWRRDRWPPSIS